MIPGRPMRLDQAPEVETIIIQNGHYPAGTGEPATTVVAPAIANAIESAVGARVRSIPMTPEKIKSALREAISIFNSKFLKKGNEFLLPFFFYLILKSKSIYLKL